MVTVRYTFLLDFSIKIFCCSMMKSCKKVGEGVYGEVFRTQNNGKWVAIKVTYSCFPLANVRKVILFIPLDIAVPI